MTTEEFLTQVRLSTGQVDTSTSTYTDEELLAFAKSQHRWLVSTAVPGASNFAVGSDKTEELTYGLVPEASVTDALGLILAYRTAAAVLRARYAQRMDEGSIGVTWSSGLESESTLQAGRAYQGCIDGIETDARSLIMILRAPTSATRAQ